MIALIDFDSALFFAGCKNSEGEVYSSLQSLFYTMINNTGATEYIVALTTGHNTFRHKLYPEYKANRKSKVLPENLKLAREYAHEFNPITNPDLEADDIISLYKHKYQDDAIICSPDSDFTTIPGKHYDYKKHTFYDVNPFEAEYNLYRYILSGQQKDNIKGLKSCGYVTADTYLDNVQDYLYEATLKAFIYGISKKDYKIKSNIKGLGVTEGTYQFTLNYMLISMLKTQEDLFKYGINFNFVEPCKV